jgi:hypothetical protein
MPRFNEMFNERKRTTKSSVSMKIAAALTAGFAILGAGSSFVELAIAANDSDNANSITYNNTGSSASVIKADKQQAISAEDQAHQRALDIFLATTAVDGLSLSFIELRHRQLSNPGNKRFPVRLLGIHSLRYGITGGLSGPVSSIISNSNRAYDIEKLGGDPYFDARHEIPPTDPETPPQGEL